MANTGKYVGITGGVLQEELAINTTAGAADANKIIKTDSSGLLAATMLPVGVGPEVVTITASEAIAAGAYVNIWNSTGLKVRNADATVAGKEAVGFSLLGASNAASCVVYLSSQTNTAASGRAIGAKQFLSTTPGTSQETAPAASGNVVQQLGFATSATSVLFEPLQAITLA